MRFFFGFIAVVLLSTAICPYAYAESAPTVMSINAAADISSPLITEWKKFFDAILPTTDRDFSSIKGPRDNVPFIESYAATASFPRVVQECNIEHGGQPGATFWSLGCKAPQYSRENGSEAIARDIATALPSGFQKSADRYGNPIWVRGSVTVTAWLVLDTDNVYTVMVCHAVDPKGCST